MSQLRDSQAGGVFSYLAVVFYIGPPLMGWGPSTEQSAVVIYFIEGYFWHVTLFKFQVYNLMIWYLYTLQNDHNKSSYHPSPSIVRKILFLFFSLWWGLLRFTLSNFQIYNTVLLTIATILYIISPWLIYFVSGYLYLLTPFTHLAHHPVLISLKKTYQVLTMYQA